METLREHRAGLTVLSAVVAPFALALLLVPFRGSFTNTAAALLFVAVIVAMAVVGNRLSGVVASVSSALWFDFFLTLPYERLAISHRPDIETTTSILVVGLIVTELAARNRHHRDVAVAESDYVAIISGLTELAASGASTSSVIEYASASIIELLGLRACRFETAASNGRVVARVQADGTIVHAGVSWPAEESGIPGPESEILVQWHGEMVGRFMLTPASGRPVALRPRIVAVSVANLVGASLSDHQQVP